MNDNREWESMTVAEAKRLTDNRMIWWRPNEVVNPHDPESDLVKVAIYRGEL